MPLVASYSLNDYKGRASHMNVYWGAVNLRAYRTI
jgi:hypothetical protein